MGRKASISAVTCTLLAVRFVAPAHASSSKKHNVQVTTVSPVRTNTQTNTQTHALTSSTPQPLIAPPPEPAWVPPAENFTIDTALRAMRATHPQLLAARASAQAARGDVTTAGLWTNPILSINYTRSIGYTTYDPIVGYPQVGVTQFIETSDAPSARRRAAQGEVAARDAEVNAVDVSLSFDVLESALRQTAVIRRARVANESLRQLQEARRIVYSRVSAGASPHYDASRIDLAVADAQAVFDQLRADLVSARLAFDTAVGPRAEQLVGAPVFDLDVPFPLPDAPAAESTMLTTRPDILAGERRVEATRATIEVARRNVFPGFSVYAGLAFGAGYGAAPDVPGGARQFDVSVGVNIPLAVVDRGQGSVPAAQARTESAARALDAQQLAARQRLRLAFEERTQRSVVLERFRSSARLQNEEMLREATAGYTAGKLSVLELVDAIESHRDVQLRMIELTESLRASELRVLRTVGAR